MKRREFITLLGGAAVAWPLATNAQQPDRVRRVGVLMGVPESNSAKVWVSAFVQGLAALGWEDGRNVRVDTRWTGGDISKVKSYAAELVSLKPDVIVAAGTQGATVLQQETTSIPIVGVQVGDLVASGLVTSLARPDGNITGFTNFEGSIGGKWVATLKEVAPGIDRVGVILNPDNIAHAGLSRTIETSSLSLGLRVTAIPVRSAAQIEVLVNAFAPGSRGALIILPDTVILSHVNLIIALAARHQLPAVYPYRDYVANGGLVSYGPDPTDFYRRAADYVDRIFKGAKPADLPIQQPTKFELIINLKAAKALGLEVPSSFYWRADEVIE